MKKLNNKGMTAIEVLICFSIVSVIAISMLHIVNNFRVKEEVESYKMRITTFKNTVSRAILKDIMDNGGIKKLDSYVWDTYTEQTDIPSPNGPISLMNYNYVKITPLEGGYEEEVKIVLNNDDTRILRIKQIDKSGVDSYIYYAKTKNETIVKETTYKLPKIPNLTFNESRILIDHDEEINYFLKVTIGFNHPDLGNQFDAFDFALPISDNFPTMIDIY